MCVCVRVCSFLRWQCFCCVAWCCIVVKVEWGGGTQNARVLQPSKRKCTQCIQKGTDNCLQFVVVVVVIIIVVVIIFVVFFTLVVSIFVRHIAGLICCGMT